MVDTGLDVPTQSVIGLPQRRGTCGQSAMVTKKENKLSDALTASHWHVGNIRVRFDHRQNRSWLLHVTQCNHAMKLCNAQGHWQLHSAAKSPCVTTTRGENIGRAIGWVEKGIWLFSYRSTAGCPHSSWRYGIRCFEHHYTLCLHTTIKTM